MTAIANKQSKDVAAPDLSGSARLAELQNRFGEDISDIDVQQALDILAHATFLSPSNRALFWARDGSLVPDPRTGEMKSLNEVIIDVFKREQNARLLGNHSDDGTHPALYVSMHDLAEGRALKRIIQPGANRPASATFEGWEFRNDSFAASDALIDAVATTFSKRASGIVTVSLGSAETDSFFIQSDEFRNIIDNPAIKAVRVLDLASDQPLSEEIALERGDELHSQGLESSFFRNKSLNVAERIFKDKAQWEQWQRNEWLATSIAAVRAHASGQTDFQNFRSAAITTDNPLASEDYAQVRFLCEVYGILKELSSLEHQQSRTQESERRYQHEVARLDQAQALIRDVPAVLRPMRDPRIADTINKIHVKQTVFELDVRDQLLANCATDPATGLRHANLVLDTMRQSLKRYQGR